MTPSAEYLSRCRDLLAVVEQQQQAIQQAAQWFAETILAGRMVHLFGSGHSRILVEEMWPRYGSFPGFNPIVELSLTFHNSVVGANGQRQAMFLENVSGLAERIPIEFVIGNDGQVKKLWVDHPRFADGALQECLMKELQRWPFRPYEGQQATVGLSFTIGKGAG